MTDKDAEQDGVPPALTPEEWAKPYDAGKSLDFDGDAVENKCCGCKLPTRHALAALALHGQPFGFTHEDVEAVEWDWHPDDKDMPQRLIDRLESLATRLRALLPPE